MGGGKWKQKGIRAKKNDKKIGSELHSGFGEIFKFDTRNKTWETWKETPRKPVILQTAFVHNQTSDLLANIPVGLPWENCKKKKRTSLYENPPFE